MATTWVDFQAVKTAVPIESVLERYSLLKILRRQGSELHGCCPIHKGTNQESFRVNVSKNCFQCFAGSCGAKGNVLDFVAAMEKCSVRDAALKLQDWFSLAACKSGQTKTPPANSELAGEKRVGETGVTDSKSESTTEPNKRLSFELRGIYHGHSYLTGRGISTETAEHFGTGIFSGKGSMSGRCVIPIHNERGELMAYAGRSIDGSEPRYKLPAGFRKSQEVYNLHRAIQTDQKGFIVVEGFFDCMKVHQAGYPFVVALMGSSLSGEQERLLVENASMVLLMLDGDEAGRKATEEIMIRLGRQVWVKSVRVPDNKQPDQMTDGELEELLQK
jgi:DNA primase